MSNQFNKVNLEFDRSDLPMLFDMLQLGRATALMSGHKVARDRAEYYLEQIKELLPPCHKIFDGEQWPAISASLKSGSRWNVYIDDKYLGYGGEVYNKSRYDHTTFRMYIHIDDKRYIDYKWGSKFTDEDVRVVRDFVNELAPLTCVEDPSLITYDDVRKR